MLEDALAHLVRGIVDNPDDVSVTSRADRRGKSGQALDVRVNPADMGRVIGRSGRTATALRTVVSAINEGRGVRFLMLEDALAHLVRGIVDNPDDVSVTSRADRRGKSGQALDVRVNPTDMGRVIGRSGRTATALRTVVSAINEGRGVRIDFLDAAER